MKMIADKNCSGASLFSCGDDSCVPYSLVCNKRTNCLYKKDEHGCKFSQFFIISLSFVAAIIIFPFFRRA